MNYKITTTKTVYIILIKYLLSIRVAFALTAPSMLRLNRASGRHASALDINFLNN